MDSKQPRGAEPGRPIRHPRPGSGLAAGALVALSAVALLAAPLAFGAGSTGVTVSDFQFGPSVAKPAQGGTVAWTFNGPSTHTVTEASALHLFNSGEQRPGGHFSFKFGSAGTYSYHCLIHSNMHGTVQVPVLASPLTGGAATSFTIRWAAASASGFTYDVQVKRPGSSSFVTWKSGLTAPSAAFKADAGKGTYAFRARLHKAGSSAASGWSPARTIGVA